MVSIVDQLPFLQDSVLVLYRSYPGDPDLQEYLKSAIQAGMLSIATFVSTLLQAARSTELHAPATLDMLCRIALDAHYSSGSGLPAVSSVVSFSDSPMTVSNTLQDALALLQIAHGLPMSHFHQLRTSASELVILLFSCADMSQVPQSPAMVILHDASAMINHVSISQDVRQVLEAFTLSLTLLLGEDVKVNPDAQIMQSLQVALGKSDGVASNSNSNTDTVSFSLTLSYLVTHRADEFGSGSGGDPAALFVSLLRWTSWTPAVFYTQLLLSAFICLSESVSASPSLWRAFIIGRLPHILISFEKILNSDNATPENWRGALQIAVTTTFRRSELLERCERRLMNQATSPHAPHTEDFSRSFTRDFLRQLLLSGLVDQAFILVVDPSFANSTSYHLQTEAQDAGLDLDSYIYSKLSPDLDFEDARVWIERIWNDSSGHKTFAEVALRRFTSSAASLDTETLSHLCRIFYLCDAALDMISLHLKISDLLFQALLFLEESDCETVGDPQTAVSHLGDVVLFVQSTLTRFHLETDIFTFRGRAISSAFLRSTAVVHRIDELSEEDAVAFNAWYKALFDSSSEGIEDTILRSTQPKILLRISASLFSHAIKDANIDNDVLVNGISYFTGPLLRWTLIGVVLALIQEIRLKGFSAPKHFSVLQTLLLSSACPRPVHCLCGQSIIALLSDKRVKNIASTAHFDALAIHQVTASALGLDTAQSQSVALRVQATQPRQAIRDVVARARAAKAPSLDLERCIKTVPPLKFLQMFWSELLAPASLGEMDICMRLATFTLTMPRPFGSPPFLPMFLNILLPALISPIDKRPAAEQTMAIELLGSIVSSLLTASLHLDLAFADTSRPVLGQPSIVMARRVATDLRFRAKRHGNASTMILQRLSSSQSFVANFPVFKSES
ncbi:mediator complex subunit Med5-domain-containing protein [Mycena sp. CBHHK59/15]|nr:mediator complex subunit Med5-domain-containing protein [Mycena sp. CBHHK59/15]